MQWRAFVCVCVEREASGKRDNTCGSASVVSSEIPIAHPHTLQQMDREVIERLAFRFVSLARQAGTAGRMGIREMGLLGFVLRAD